MTETTLDLSHRPRRQAPLTGALLATVIRGAVRILAPWFGTDATRAGVARHAHEAAAVRALAQRHRDSDRSFAADLYAAADRHQAAGDGRATGSH